MATLRSGIDWDASTYADVLARHRWDIPRGLNVAEVACSRHARGNDKLALVEAERTGDGFLWKRHTFDDLERLSGGFARGLCDMGVQPGDRVAVFLPQRLEAAVAHLATIRLGGIAVPLSPLFRTEALRYRLEASASKVLVTDAEHLPFVRDVARDLGVVVICAEADVGGTESFDSVVAGTPLPCAETSADDPVMLIFTSGTSGPPKGALHAHRFLPGRLSGFELVHGLERTALGDRPFWTPADWAWVGGLVDCVLTPWVFGCPVLAFRRRGFDPQEAFHLIRDARVRSLFLPPTAVHRLREADAPGLDVHSVHTAGEPLTAAAFEWARATFGRVLELYGMTEMGALVGNSTFFDVVPGAMGKPYPGHDVVLLEDERVLEGEGTGEIAVRRGDPGMFLGYWNDPAGTAARFRGEFFCTGDLARRDADGYLFYVGRNDDMFNTSGYRVGPTEIEETLSRHPAVLEAAVVGEPDPDRGHVVKAFLIPAPGVQPSSELVREIQAFVKRSLAAYEYPRRIVFARDLPRTVTGKVRRNVLRQADADDRYGLEIG